MAVKMERERKTFWYRLTEVHLENGQREPIFGSLFQSRPSLAKACKEHVGITEAGSLQARYLPVVQPTATNLKEPGRK